MTRTLCDKIEIKHIQNMFYVRFGCDLDSTTVSEVRETVNNIDDITEKNILIDLSSVHFVDSHGVGLFASFLKSAHGNGGVLAFSGVHDQPKSVLEMVGFNEKIVKFFENSETAIEHLS